MAIKVLYVPITFKHDNYALQYLESRGKEALREYYEKLDQQADDAMRVLSEHMETGWRIIGQVPAETAKAVNIAFVIQKSDMALDLDRALAGRAPLEVDAWNKVGD